MIPLAIVIFAGLCLLVWMAWIEPRQLRVLHYDVPLKDLKAPLRAVVVADIQPNTYHWPAQRLEETFRKIAADEDPDLVLWLGDYFNAPTDKMKELLDQNRQLRRWVDLHLPRMRDIAAAMAPLRGRLATVAVLGNHDWAWSGARTQTRLEENGIVVLKDQIHPVEIPETGQRLEILGYEDLSSGRDPQFARLHGQLTEGVPQIALSHSPDAFPSGRGGPPIMICGHTHGGQVRLPFFGPVLLPLQFKEFDRGWFGDGDRRLFVSSGLGTSLPPIRLLCPPEIVVLNFVPEGEASDG